MRPILIQSNMLKKLYFLSLTLAALLLSAPVAQAGADITYYDGETVLQGYWAVSACDNESGQDTPVVMIVHQWKGLGDYEKKRADMLAGECYHAFAIDMYGKGVRPESREEAAAQSGQYKNDPARARQRLDAALAFAREKAGGKNVPVAVIGYCFGGTMALELARSGADINAAISFHGGLGSPQPVTESGMIKAAIQVHHGAADPHVPPEEVDTFITEMDNAGADWHFTSYADAVHSFTEKEAGTDPSTGSAYNEKADKRSWAYTLAFLESVRGK